MSIHRKTFVFASKQHPQVPNTLKFVGQAKTAKSTEVLALEHFVLSGNLNKNHFLFHFWNFGFSVAIQEHQIISCQHATSKVEGT